MSSFATPYPAELLQVARKVVWYDAPKRTLQDLPTFRAHLMATVRRLILVSSSGTHRRPSFGRCWRKRRRECSHGRVGRSGIGGMAWLFHRCLAAGFRMVRLSPEAGNFFGR